MEDAEAERRSVFHHDVQGCFVCGKPVDDPLFRCRVRVVREWQPEVVSEYVAHVECLRRIKHQTIGL
jgi:hypothetical protein